MSLRKPRKGFILDENIPKQIAQAFNLFLPTRKLKMISAKQVGFVSNSDRHHIESRGREGYIFVTHDHNWLLDDTVSLWLPFCTHPAIIVSDKAVNKLPVWEIAAYFLKLTPVLLDGFTCDEAFKVIRVKESGEVVTQTVDEAVQFVVEQKKSRVRGRMRDRSRLESLVED